MRSLIGDVGRLSNCRGTALASELVVDRMIAAWSAREHGWYVGSRDG